MATAVHTAVYSQPQLLCVINRLATERETLVGETLLDGARSLVPPCAPKGLLGKAWYKVLEPVSAYQEYAGIVFFVNLLAIFFERKIKLSAKSIRIDKIWQFLGGTRSPLCKNLAILLHKQNFRLGIV